jgi:hypothetical protein
MQSRDDESTRLVSNSQQTEDPQQDLASLRVTVRSGRRASSAMRSSKPKSTKHLPTLLKKQQEVRQPRVVGFDEVLSALVELCWQPPVRMTPKMAYIPKSQQTSGLKSLSSANLSFIQGCPLRIVRAVSSASVQDLPFNPNLSVVSTKQNKPRPIKRKVKQTRPASREGYRTKFQRDPVIVRTSYGQYVYADTYQRDSSFLYKTRNTLSRVACSTDALK